MDSTEAADRIEALERALEPFAEFADWIAANHPSWDTDAHEVQQHDFPYSLSIGWFRAARAALHSEGKTNATPQA